MTQNELINKLLTARSATTYKTLDRYLTQHKSEITPKVREALEAYEMYRQVLKDTK